MNSLLSTDLSWHSQFIKLFKPQFKLLEHDASSLSSDYLSMMLQATVQITRAWCLNPQFKLLKHDTSSHSFKLQPGLSYSSTFWGEIIIILLLQAIHLGYTSNFLANNPKLSHQSQYEAWHAPSSRISPSTESRKQSALCHNLVSTWFLAGTG